LVENINTIKILKMKIILVLLSLLTMPSILAMDESAEHKRKIRALYDSISGVAGVLDYNAFYKGATGYYAIREKGSFSTFHGSGPANDRVAHPKTVSATDSPLLTIVDFNKNAAEDRLFVINLSSRELITKTIVAHGANSNPNDGSSDWYRKANKTPATFSNEKGSHQSSLGFYITTGEYQGANGRSMAMYGIDSDFNNHIHTRLVVLHSATYVKDGAVGPTWGCLGVKIGLHEKLIDLLQNGKIIYVHQNNYNSSDIVSDSSFPSGVDGSRYGQTANVSITDDDHKVSTFLNNPEFANIIGQTFAGSGGETLNGPEEYEQCQGHSTKSWKATGQSSDVQGALRASYGDLDQKFANNRENISISEVTQQTNDHYNELRECAALSYATSHTSYDDPNLNQAIAQSSTDEGFPCVRNGAISQDSKACLEYLSAYDETLKEREELNANQAKGFEDFAQGKTEVVMNSGNIQIDALKAQRDANTLTTQYAQQSAQLENKQLEILAAVRDNIPTKESLIKECKTRMKNEYNEQQATQDFKAIVGQYDSRYTQTPTQQPACENIITKLESELIQNTEARHRANEIILKKADKESEYYKKAAAFKARAAAMGKLNSGITGGINFNDSMSADNCEDCSANDRSSNAYNGSSSSYGANGKYGRNGNSKFGLNGSSVGNQKTVFSNNRNKNYKKRKGSSSSNNFMAQFGSKFNKNKKGSNTSKVLNFQNNKEYAMMAKQGASKNRNFFNNSRTISSVGANGSRDESNFRNASDLMFDINENKNLNIFDIISVRYRKKFTRP
jgi:hypothetical protein